MEDAVAPAEKKNTLIVFIIAFLLTFPTIPFLLYRYGINAKVQNSSDTTFLIKQGQSVTEISDNLKDAGLVNSPFLFKVYLRLNNLENNMQAGVYVVPPRSSIVQLADILQYGRNDVTIQYTEGIRVEELALILDRELSNINYSDFVKEARDLEGYLFADTYIFNKDINQEDVIDILRENFESKTSELLTKEKLERVDLSKEEVIILASLVEREVFNFEDRKLVAGILIKRLREGMQLDVDATTQYAVALEKHCTDEVCKKGLTKELLEGIKWWPVNLTKADLDFDSPYNTRKIAGIPPKPISSFSLNALKAVIEYEESPYYFYLNDSQGNTHFAVDYSGHNINIQKYLR